MKLYLDIETSGLSPDANELTVLGALKGNEFVQLVHGKNLSEKSVGALFENVSEIVSFNGVMFDVPFLKRAYPSLCLGGTHTDLMVAGWKVGLKGGLKAIEAQLGIARSSGVKNGFEAVRLWQAACSGNADCLERLLAYNREDVMNLVLLEEKIREREQLALAKSESTEK